jgi:hypothetical protein
VKLPEFWKTYAAVLVLAGLGAYIYFVERKKPEAGDSKPKEKVFTLDKAKVGELTIASSEGGTIKLVREGTGWKMTAPSAVSADAAAVDTMISSLESLEIDEVVADNPTNLGDFGLDKPKLSVEALAQGSPRPVKLLVGAKLADGSGVYAKLPASNRVFSVASWTVGSFEKKPFDLRDRDLLHVKRENVKTLEIGGPDGSYALARTDKDEWAFSKPLVTRAGRWSVDSLLGTLESLRMESVAAEAAKDLKPFGLAKPERTVTVGLSDGSSRTLEIGGPAGDKKDKKFHAQVAGSPLVAVIPGALVDDLTKGMKELRAKRLLEVATYEVQGFDALLGTAKKTCAKSTTKDKDGLDKAQWKRTAPDAKDLDTNKVEDALFKLGGVEVQEFVDQPKEASAYGLDAPAFKLVLRMGAGKGEASVELGKKEGAVYARRPGDSSVLKLDPAKADELIKGFSEL